MRSVVTQVRPDQLAGQLRMTVMRLSRRLRQHAPEDITPSQLSALAVIVRDTSLTLSQLAEAERVQPPTITRVVDTLEKRGLVTRAVSPEDRRVTLVAATAEGRALVETIRRRRDAYLARHLRSLSADDLSVLARASELLQQFIEDPVA